jgi:UDP-N-acetylmuramate--alanine ligase
VLNALAAAIVGHVLDVPDETVATGLAEFRGVGRRQEILGEVLLEGGSVLVMDDYAHHPTEIRATLDALRAAYPERRLVAIFQPHLYSRTRDFLPQFAEALATADALIVTDIYAAREAPMEGVRAADIMDQAAKINPNAPALFVPEKRDIPARLTALVRPGDLTVFLGAGDIREQGEAFVELMRGRAEK